MLNSRMKELLAMLMIGDAVLTPLFPRRHCLLWKFGPQPYRDLMQEFAAQPGMTRLLGAAVSEVRSIDLERGSVQQVTKVKLELMVADEHAQMVVQAIHKHAHTGNSGDGRIFVIPIEETVKIRAAEPLNLRTKEKNDE